MSRKQTIAAQNKLLAEQLLYQKQCPVWIRSLSRNDMDIAAVIQCNQSLQQVKDAFIYTYHNELLLLQLANGMYRLSPDGSDQLVKPVFITNTVSSTTNTTTSSKKQTSPTKTTTTTTENTNDVPNATPTATRGKSNSTPTASGSVETPGSTNKTSATTTKTVTAIQYQSISYDEVSQELQELCVDYLLRFKLRRKLISRIIRRLHRIASSMDHTEQMSLNLPSSSSSTTVLNTVNSITDIIIPPGPPKYGDLRLYCDPNAVQQYEMIRTKQNALLQQIVLSREQQDDIENRNKIIDETNPASAASTVVGSSLSLKRSHHAKAKGSTVVGGTGSSASTSSSFTTTNHPETVSSESIPEEIQQDEAKDQTLNVDMIPPSKEDDDDDEKEEKHEASVQVDEKSDDQEKVDEPTVAESSNPDTTNNPTVIVSSSAAVPTSEEHFDESDTTDYDLLRDYKDAYEKTITCTIVVDEQQGTLVPNNVTSFLQTVMDNTSKIKYTILQNPREEDYNIIQNGTGIGATNPSMTPEEREAEYYKWKNNILSRIPDQPTYSELGLEHRVFLYKERLQRAMKQRQEKLDTAMSPTVSPSKPVVVDEDVKSSLKRKFYNDEDAEMDDDGEYKGEKDKISKIDNQVTENTEQKDENDDGNDGLINEDDVDKEIKDGDDKDEEKESNVVPKTIRPISLVAIPSFYEQDLKRIKLVQADLMSSSMRLHAIQQLEDVTREFNQCLANSMELANHRTILQNQITQLSQQIRALTQSVQSDYMVQVSLAKNRWNLERCSFETKKLNKMLPSRNGIMPTGTIATQNYKIRPDMYVVGLNEVVATCIADIVDCVDSVAHGRIRNEKWKEPFVLPSASADVDALQRAKQLETNKRNELNSYTLKLRTSEGERLRAWRKMLKTKLEYDIPHQHYSSSGQIRILRLDPHTCTSLPLPALHQTAAQDLPQQLPGQSSKVASYTPMHTVRQPSNNVPLSESKYSTARVRERIASDGTVAPVTKPKMMPDGLYARPAGRTRKGMEWDAVRGIWIPGSEAAMSS